MTKILILAFILVFESIICYAQNEIELFSPDGNIHFSFMLVHDGPTYSIDYKKKSIIKDAGLSLDFHEQGIFKNGLAYSRPVFRNATEQYDLVVGKAKSVKETFSIVKVWTSGYGCQTT